MTTIENSNEIPTFEQASDELERACAIVAVYWGIDKLEELVLFARKAGEDYLAGCLAEVLVAKGGERTWELSEAGEGYGECTASSPSDAIEEARGNVDRANYPVDHGTLWIDVSVRCPATGEEESTTVQLDEPEPECESGSSHDWRSPYSLLGGLRENPGVQGHGGGVIIREVCVICGCERTTDTWAQRPDTGEQGLTSVSYEPGAHEIDNTLDAIRWDGDVGSWCGRWFCRAQSQSFATREEAFAVQSAG